MKCPACQGTGRKVVRGARDPRRHGVRPVEITPCPECGGCGAPAISREPRPIVYLPPGTTLPPDDG